MYLHWPEFWRGGAAGGSSSPDTEGKQKSIECRPLKTTLKSGLENNIWQSFLQWFWPESCVFTELSACRNNNKKNDTSSVEAKQFDSKLFGVRQQQKSCEATKSKCHLC